jgi:hypothetical protein
MPTPTPGERITEPPGGLSAVAPEPPAVSDDPLSDLNLTDELPMPPPPDLGAEFRRSRAGNRRLLQRVLVGLVAVILLLAAHDSWKMFDHIGSLNAILGSAQQATPALKRDLDQELLRLGLQSSVARRWSLIEGETDRFQIGVEVRHRIVGLPTTYTAEKSGPFTVKRNLPTLEIFTDGGWQLDEVAQQALQEYKASRRK